MNKHLLLALMLLGLSGTAAAQLDQAQVSLHPQYPGSGPFVLEVSGTWNSNCNPEAATPTITQFDGWRLFIDLDLEAQPCISDHPFHYRLLVDASPAFDGDENYTGELLLILEFAGEDLITTLPLECPDDQDCPEYAATAWPETGLFQSRDLEKQGLLVARQNASLAVYPLVYDANGDAEWLFAGGTIRGNAYFAPLHEASGGQCLGCPPPDEPPSVEPIGDVTMVFEESGTLLMQLDDGPFVEYRQSVYGYALVDDVPRFADFTGRWAVADSGTEVTADGSIPLALALPGVFDLKLESVRHSDPLESPTWVAGVYSVRDVEGQLLTEMHCYNHALCSFAHPDPVEDSHVYRGDVLSTDRVSFEDLYEIPEDATRAGGVIVRIGP